MRLYLRLLAALLAVCILTAAGCGLWESKRRPAPEGPKIGFSIADERRDGNQALKKAVEERARRDDVPLTWKDAGGDPLQQEQDIDKLIEQKMEAVVVQPADPQMGPGMVRRLTMNKIKVVALETLPPDSPVDGFVASDHVAAGELQARFLQDNTPTDGEARAVMLAGDPNDPMAQGIVEAVRDALEGTAWTIEVHDHPQSEPSRAGATVDEILAEGTPAAFLATDSRMAVAAVEKLRQRGLAEQVLTLGVGADRTAAEALVTGDHDAEVDVMPEQLGQFTYEAALGLAEEGRWQYDSQTMDGNFSVPTRITPVRLIEADDAFLLEERYGDLTRVTKKSEDEEKEKGAEDKDDKKKDDAEEQGDAEGEDGAAEKGGDEEKAEKTRLIITTQDGKTVEIDVPGEVRSIETQPAGGGGE